MKLLILVLTFITLSASALEPEQMKFTYMTYDGDQILHCKHFAIDEFKFDWDVTCKNKEGTFYKLYRAHVSLAKYSRPSIPMTTYEVLYWVTEKSSGQVYGSSTSLWFNFKNEADFHGLTISQSVEKETAGLYLDIKP